MKMQSQLVVTIAFALAWLSFEVMQAFLKALFRPQNLTHSSWVHLFLWMTRAGKWLAIALCLLFWMIWLAKLFVP
ncbi:MAG: hypothetical protein AAF666_06300 [Pseudomonadota bacterium]